MNNVLINYAESIFEPFWDTGESYPDHQKYSKLANYSIEYGKAIAEIATSWAGVNVMVEKQQQGEPIVMKRDCDLDISEYDTFRLFASVPKAFKFKIYADIDGERRLIIEETGNDTTGEYDGKIKGRKLSHIRFEFENTSSQTYTMTLYWLGLSNSIKLQEMVRVKSTYDSNWEGCFEKEFEVKPMIGIYFGEQELEDLRLKVNKHPFNKIMNNLRKGAEADLKLVPESDIRTYAPHVDRRWVRDCDMNRLPIIKSMERLAFVGIVDKNVSMLVMACRMALSVAHSTYWCESIMGVFPGATWHHRSFTEEEICRACSLVLDWGGELLTWHGKNIIYDAIIQKGLPRIEADFKTVDYIRNMNQGIVFSSGRITALIALSHRYPRYQSWLKDAEKDLHEMVDTYILSDGGTVEGPGYWDYTFSHTLPIVYILARFRKVPLKEYVWDKLKLTAEYALAMLSDCENGVKHLPINDAHFQPYNPVISAMYSQITEDVRWKRIYSHMLDSMSKTVDKEFLMIAPEIEKEEGSIFEDGFISLDQIGQASLRQSTELGRIHLHLVSGPVYFSHNHGDKGSFILEVGDKPILIDRGACIYNNPYISIIGKSYTHNLFYPEAENAMAYTQSNKETIGGKIIKSSFENRTLQYCTELVGAWEKGIFKQNTRSVYSDHPNVYIIEDTIEYESATASSFRLNTYGEITRKNNYWVIIDGNIQVTIYPVNYKPVKDEYGKDGYDGEIVDVNQLRLYIEKAKYCKVITAIEISEQGQEKLKIVELDKMYLGDHKILWRKE